MTDEMMKLRALLEKAPDADCLREMIRFASHRLMKLGSVAHRRRHRAASVARCALLRRGWRVMARNVGIHLVGPPGNADSALEPTRLVVSQASVGARTGGAAGVSAQVAFEHRKVARA